MALTPDQKAEMLQLIAADYPYTEIAEKLGCSLQNVKYHADKQREKIEQLRAEYEKTHILKGFGSKNYRVQKLANLASRIERDLEDKEETVESIEDSGLWTDDVKLASNGKEVKVKTFAGEAVRQYRGLLDDIAKELGQRTSKVALTDPTGEKEFNGGSAVEALFSRITELAAKRATNSTEGENQ